MADPKTTDSKPSKILPETEPPSKTERDIDDRAIDRVFDALAKHYRDDEARRILDPLVERLDRWFVEAHTILRFDPDPGNPSECEQYIKRVFQAVVKHYGENEARRIFGPYGRPLTKREKNTDANEELWAYYYLECAGARKQKRKPNVRQLAKKIADFKGVDSVALERKIWRVIKNPPEIKGGENSDLLLKIAALLMGEFDVYRASFGDHTIEIRRSDD